MNQDQLFTIIRQIVRQEIGDIRAFKIGIVKNYDPSSNTVQVEYPGERDTNNNTMFSPRIKLLSPWVGNHYGMQVYPTGGEMCLIGTIERSTGNAAAIAFMFSDVMQPPAVAIDPPAGPGEVIFKGPSNSIIRIQANGDIRITTPTPDQGDGPKITIDSGGPIDIKAKGDVSIDSEGDVKVKAEGKLSVETSTIDIDAKDKKLTVNIEAKDDVDINADDLTVNVKSKNSNVNATNDITLDATNISLIASDSLRIRAAELVLEGENIVIGNENNGTSKTNSIRIDAMKTFVQGRNLCKVLGRTIRVGSVEKVDFTTYRIDLKTGAGVS